MSLYKNSRGDTVHSEFISFSPHYWIRKNNIKYSVIGGYGNNREKYAISVEKLNMPPYAKRCDYTFYSSWDNSGVEFFDTEDDAWNFIYDCIDGKVDIWELLRKYVERQEEEKRIKEMLRVVNEEFYKEHFPKYLESLGLTQEKFNEILRVYNMSYSEFRAFYESLNL